MAQSESQSFSTDLPLASFMSVLTLMLNRSTTRPYQQTSSVTSNSRCCIGKYLLGYPSSSCFLTHSIADSHAGLLQFLIFSIWDLERSQWRKKFATQLVCIEVCWYPKKVYHEQTYTQKSLFVYYKFVKFAQNLHLVYTFEYRGFSQEKPRYSVNFV